MAKRKPTKGARLTSDTRPTATNVDFPVFVPNEKGETNIEVGKARLRYGTLVIEFKDTTPSVAIQNMIERGVLLGLGMIMLKPDIVNEMYQDVVAEEERQSDIHQCSVPGHPEGRVSEDGKTFYCSGCESEFEINDNKENN